MPQLLAISDVHVSHAANRAIIQGITPHENDWLIVGGDVGETEDHLKFALDSLAKKFAKLIWVPGNHELWSIASAAGETPLRGEKKYEAMVRVCEARDVLTPEDPYATFGEGDDASVIAPMFLLYDYSLRPDDVPFERAVEWATEDNQPTCADEAYLRFEPHASRAAWCEARCKITEARLDALPTTTRTILVNHFPLRAEHAYLPLLPRFFDLVRYA